MGTRGGRREGSGPKKSMSPYGEKTSVIRVPASLKSEVLVYLEPFRKASVSASNGDRAGFPQAVPNPRPLPRPSTAARYWQASPPFPLPPRIMSRRRLI